MVNRWTRTLLALITALGVVVISTPTAAGNPGQIVIPADKLPAGQDGWFQHDDGTRQWIDASCRADLEAAGVNVVILDWGDLSAIPDGPQLPCSALMPTTTTTNTTTTNTTTTPATTTTTVGSGSSSGQIVIPADKLPAGQDGWFQHDDGTRQWIDASCRADLQAAGVNVVILDWGDLSAIPDGPQLPCTALMPTTTTTTPATTTTTAAPTTTTAPAGDTPRLAAGDRLHAGDKIVSSNGTYRVVMQGDGNLVLYTGSRVLWASNTAGHPGAYAVLQGDGNLVIYRNGQALWASNTAGRSGAYATIQNDGNFVIYQHGAARWASDTMQGGSLTITLTENPFVCDGTSRPIGVISGAIPGERIDLSAPGATIKVGYANSDGNRYINWFCYPSSAGKTWLLTAQGVTSGRVGTATIYSASAPTSGGGADHYLNLGILRSQNVPVNGIRYAILGDTNNGSISNATAADQIDRAAQLWRDHGFSVEQWRVPMLGEPNVYICLEAYPVPLEHPITSERLERYRNAPENRLCADSGTGEGLGGTFQIVDYQNVIRLYYRLDEPGYSFDRFDFKHVAAHEFGHAFGLTRHVPGTIMNASTGPSLRWLINTEVIDMFSLTSEEHVPRYVDAVGDPLYPAAHP